ncbi:MAG: hypothetical protein GTO63_16020, partial [Anaerolineae bacterium]|nr:hypothetical protein [Anaerolineae bacterium]NIN96334.1 hypothetical protein [Anaerolineae bacterium]
TILFSAPVAFSKYVLDLKEVRASRSQALVEMSGSMLEKMEGYNAIISGLGSPAPENLMDLKTKMLIVEDEVKEISRNAGESIQDLSEIDVDLRRIYNELKVDVESFETQLDIALRDFYIKIKF